jgi:putative tricarboxylic transport membrane protein
MDALSDLLGGFATALTPTNVGFALLGVLLGTAIGVLPGIGPAMTIALLLPLTRGVEVTSALIMFAGIYYGGMYGGSTTSILLNTPGESASVVTAIEGNKMAKAGRAAQALATAAVGSFVAGTIATFLLAMLAPVVAKLAIEISPADMFAVMMLAFIAVTSVLGSSRIRGLASLGLGLRF